ncbi:hypothetical protein [Acetobacter tropicalis]|uniref:hypothetical protein n=1 Tax=Acetobacter tropicalis TaxID=104102 RepID=UPI000A4BF3EA|nr:hypothetical protein [Acetobacter tropicalis]
MSDKDLLQPDWANRQVEDLPLILCCGTPHYSLFCFFEKYSLLERLKPLSLFLSQVICTQPMGRKRVLFFNQHDPGVPFPSA